MSKERKCRWCNQWVTAGKYRRTNDPAVLSGRIFICTICNDAHERARKMGVRDLNDRELKTAEAELARLAKKFKKGLGTPEDFARYRVGSDCILTQLWRDNVSPKEDRSRGRRGSLDPVGNRDVPDGHGQARPLVAHLRKNPPQGLADRKKGGVVAHP